MYINVYSRTNTIFPIPSFLCLHWNWIFHFLFEIIMEYYVILKSLNIGIWEARELTIHWYKNCIFIYSKIISLHFYRQFSLIINIFQYFFIIYIQKIIYNSHTAHTFYIVMFFNVEIYSMMLKHQSKKNYSYCYITNHQIKKGTAIDENGEFISFLFLWIPYCR